MIIQMEMWLSLKYCFLLTFVVQYVRNTEFSSLRKFSRISELTFLCNTLSKSETFTADMITVITNRLDDQYCTYTHLNRKKLNYLTKNTIFPHLTAVLHAIILHRFTQKLNSIDFSHIYVSKQRTLQNYTVWHLYLQNKIKFLK